MPEIQHTSKLVPISSTSSAKGTVLRLPFDAGESTALQRAVGQMVTIGSGTATVTGLLIRFSPLDNKQMEIEVASTR